MLYCDQTADSESEAVEAAMRKLRLDKEHIIVRSVQETDKGVRVRCEAAISRGQDAHDILQTILNCLKLNAELFYIESFERILINVNGPQLGLIIGKGGSTLEALETIISAMHNNEYTMFKPVVINPGGYRDNKSKALKNMVRRAVDAASKGEKVTLPLMKQRDRKQVHQIIKEFPGFASRSFGDGTDRRVFIYLESDDESEAGSDPDSGDEDATQVFIPPDRVTEMRTRALERDNR